MLARLARHPRVKNWFSKVGYVPADAETSLGPFVDKYNMALLAKKEDASDAYKQGLATIVAAEVRQAPSTSSSTKILIAFLGLLGSSTVTAVFSSIVAENEKKRTDAEIKAYKDDALAIQRAKDREIDRQAVQIKLLEEQAVKLKK